MNKYLHIGLTVLNEDGSIDREYGWPKIFEQKRYFPVEEKEVFAAIEELRRTAAMFAGRQSLAKGDLLANRKLEE